MIDEKIINIGDFTVDNMTKFFDNYEDSFHESIVFDFSSCNKARLLPALVFNSWMKTIDVQRRVMNINNANGGSYLENIGFFKELKVKGYENQKIYYNHTKKHIPIMSFTEEYYREINSDKDINDNITDEMNKVSQQIFSNVNFNKKIDKEMSIKVMTFLLREIIRNVFEHSKSTVHSFAMQIQENNNRIEIAILDEGVGIASSYSSNNLFKNYTQSPKNALKRSLVPGSSRMYKNSIEISQKQTSWENSGFGLFMSSRICARLNGSFNLISSGHHIKLTYDNKSNEYKQEFFTNPLKGCAIGLEFNLDDLSQYDKIYKLIISEVEESQKNIKHLFENPSTYSNPESLKVLK